jgi:hypothetical protein
MTTVLRRSVAEPAAFDQFYRAHAESVLLFLTRRTLDAQVALDLTDGLRHPPCMDCDGR